MIRIGWAVAPALIVSASARGQQEPPVRQIGRLERVSTDSLASVATALPLANGSVYVNDVIAHRVLLFDSTLKRPRLVADSTSLTGEAYGRAPGVMISYHGDSALFIDMPSLSMLLLDPSGKIARALAIPRPDDALFMWRAGYGTPGFDARGRLVYYQPVNAGGRRSGNAAPPANPSPDTALIVAFDLTTRKLDTVASFRLPRDVRITIERDDQGNVRSIQGVPDPTPLYDGWTIVSDGSIAVVRGSDYHVDWLDRAGKWTATPKVPFNWQRLDDDQKRALIDSVAAARQAVQAAASRKEAARGAGRARSGSAPAIRTVGRLAIGDVRDYRPPFGLAAVRADADDHVWVRTTAHVDGREVYDVINRRGELIDRVQLPSFRAIAGFGPGVIYMAVKDSSGIVHLERARAR